MHFSDIDQKCHLLNVSTQAPQPLEDVARQATCLTLQALQRTNTDVCICCKGVIGLQF
jgi:nicotinamide mononucleotide (NMN) deamidase PncC